MDVLGDTIFRCEVWLASGIFLGVVVRLEDVGATLYWCGSGCGVAVEVLKRQWWSMDGVESTRQRVACLGLGAGIGARLARTCVRTWR